MKLIHLKSVLLVLLLLVPRPSHAADTPPPSRADDTTPSSHAEATPPSHAGGTMLIHVAVAAYVVAHYADLHYTLTAIESGRGREANPAFEPLIASPRLGGAVTMALAVGTGWALIKLHDSHPKTAIAAALVGTAVFSGLAYHNSQVGR